MYIKELLDNLFDHMSLKKVLVAKRDAVIASLPAEIRAQLDAIDADIKNVEQDIVIVTTEVKSAVLTLGCSEKGDYLQAIYTKGRPSWDGKALDGYAAAHPEILAFKKTGEPSVTIRPI